jgi:hypothetical protein
VLLRDLSAYLSEADMAAVDTLAELRRPSAGTSDRARPTKVQIAASAI